MGAIQQPPTRLRLPERGAKDGEKTGVVLPSGPRDKLAMVPCHGQAEIRGAGRPLGSGGKGHLIPVRQASMVSERDAGHTAANPGRC